MSQTELEGAPLKERILSRVKNLFTTVAGFIQIGVLLLFVAIALWYARAPNASDDDDSNEILSIESLRNLPQVRTYSPATTDVPISVQTTGNLVVRNSIRLVPQVAGRVTWISEKLRPGGEFEANETLLVIEQRDYELSLDQAQAELATAKANLRLQLAASQVSIANWRLLDEENTGNPPELIARVPQIEQVVASIEAAQARVETAQLALDRTNFSVPFAGYVTENTATLGQLISNSAAFGSAFAKSEIEAVLPISSQELTLLEPAQGRNVQLTSADGLTQFNGTVERIAADVDTRSRVIDLYVSFDEPPTLRPGTFLEASIAGPVLQGAYVLPQVSEQSSDTFWTVENDQLNEVAVNILARTEDGLVVPAFDTGQGLVVGKVPGGYIGMNVETMAIE